MKELEKYVTSIPDFPEPGIIFRDITSIVGNADGLKLAVDGLQAAVEESAARMEEEKKAGLRRAFELWKPLCEKYGCSYSNLVEAWALTQYDKMSLLVGMRRVENVADNAKCLDVALTPEDAAFMEETVKDIQEKVLDK